MQLSHYIKEFEKVIEFNNSKSIKKQLTYIRSKIDSVRITPISDLYEKWVGTQLLDVLWGDFHFRPKDKTLEEENICLKLLFPDPLPLPPESLTRNQKKEEKKEEKKKAKIKAQDENKIELYNEKLGCEVELMYEPDLRKIEAGDAKPDFYLKFTNLENLEYKISKTLIIDAKYSKYNNREELITGEIFGTSISDIAKKYYRAYDTSSIEDQDTSSPNIVFVTHPDTDVRDPLNYQQMKSYTMLCLDLLKDLDEKHEADINKLDGNSEADINELTNNHSN